MLEATWTDVKFAVRLLRRNRRNTVLAVLILGVGIGATTALFSAINYVLIRPLPFRDSDRIVRLRDAVVAADGQVHPYNMRSRSVLAVREGAPVFDAMVAFSGDNMTLSGGDVPERLSVVFQTEGNDETLGVRPAFGRGFSREEERRGVESGVVLISDRFWHSHFGGLPSAIGQVLRLDDRTFTVIGVMPPQYAFPYDADVWTPIALDPSDAGRDFAVFAHVRSAATDAEVRSALAAVAADLRRQHVDLLPSYRIEAMPLRESLVSTQAAPLEALIDVVAFLLFLASVNVATLLLARSVARRREFAIRAVLGASRARHLRQLLVESFMLAILGCAVGVLIAAWIGPLTSSLIPAVLSGQLGLTTPRTDWRVLVFAMGVSLVTAMVAGVVPAFGSWRRDPQSALTDGGRAATAGPKRRTLLSALIIAETALTLLLLVGAGLVIRNFVRLATLPLGFEARRLLTFELTPPTTAYPAGPARAALIRRVIEEIRATPTVTNAGATSVNPLGGGTWGATVLAEDAAARDPNSTLNINDRLITPGLIETMGIRMVAGRSFGKEDSERTQPVVIVAERLARRLWPNADPIGKRIRIARPGTPWLTVVGIAGDVSDSHDPGVPLDTWYRLFDQNSASAAADHVYIMVRAAADPRSVVMDIKHAVARVDKTVAPYGMTAMDTYWAGLLSRERVSAAFMLGFGGFGLVLAALGVYGVMAFLVAQRTAEFGIRMALGAQRSDILPLVFGRGAALVGGGIAIGALLATILNAVLSRLLPAIDRLDGPVFGAAALMILIAALLACLLPSLQAARLDPIEALRAE